MAGQDTPRGPADGDGHRSRPPEPAATSDAVITTDLRPNSLGLVGVTMQAITHIAPAIAALFFTQFIVSLAGITAPLVDGVWLLLGIGALIFYRSQRREDWLRNAGAALGESEDEYEKVVGGPT